MMRRMVLTAASALFALALLLSFAPAARAQSFPSVISLPDGWLPEGVVTGRGPVIYAGSRASGSIYAADLRTGEGRVLVQQSGRVAVGLSFDRRSNFIYVAGGPQGTAFVYDAASGAEVAAFRFTEAQGTFINDVIVTRDGAYFTNSSRPEIYKVALDRAGRVPTDGSFTTIPLGGDWEQVQGFNANGIEATPNGRTLIIVNSTTGNLFYVDPSSGVATKIDLNGASASAGDGLLLEGQTLYVVRNRLNQIAVFEPAADRSSAVLVDTITDPNFDVPTTVASFGGALYAVNARFGVANPERASYTIVRVEP
jgi:sugar lactone lactonase YvrE